MEFDSNLHIFHSPKFKSVVDDAIRFFSETPLSEWDILHPGRPWAERLTGTSPPLEQVIAEVQRFLESSLP